MSASIAEAIFWIALALCCVAQVALLHAFFRGGARVPPGASPGFRVSETVWAVLPALVLAGLLVATRQAMQAPATVRWTPDAPMTAPAEAAVEAPR